jgi:adenosylcobinamide-GDP ribazoletransferase
MLRELRNLLSFLTVLPFRMDENMLSDCARFMFVFPLIGALIGFLAGLFGWVCLYLFLPSLVVGALVLGALLLLTGLHHTDGLLDFGDGVMAHGSAEHKVEVMHDQLTGAGGLTLGMMTLLITALAFSELSVFSNLNTFSIVISVIVVEVAAKLSMVVGAWAGKPVHEGMASSFLEAMHGGKGNARLVAALVISFGIAVPLLWLNGVIVVLAAVVTALVMVGIAHRHFHGVTGDVLGATNELARMVSVVVLVALI